MDNYNQNMYNQGQNSNYTFNIPNYANNMQNMNNRNKGWFGVLPSIIQWLIYCIDIFVIIASFIGMTIEYGDASYAFSGVLVIICGLHLLEFLIYVIIGAFQIVSIRMKKSNSFTVGSLIVNIIVFILGWIDVIFIVMLALMT